MNTKIGIILLLVALAALTAVGCAASPAASPTATPPASIQSPAAKSSGPDSEPVSLKIGSLPRMFDLIAYVAKQEGLYQKYNLQVEIVPFRSTVEMNNALLAGQLDGSIQGTFEAINLNKEKENAKLIGHNFMPRMFEVVVSSGSGISSPSLLKSKEVANGTGTIMEYAMDELLKSRGMSSKDVAYVNVPNIALRVEMLNQGKVPAAVLTSPTSDLAVSAGNKIILDDSKQLLGGPGLIFSVNALNTRSSGISRFLNAWQETVDLINASPQKYHGLLVTVAGIAEPVAAGIPVPTFPKLRLPTQPELDSIMSWMVNKGLLTQPLPYEKIVETKYLK
jgi:NitT/TauT family transport system substrate-binding protein